jgi:hypothetical protein
MKYSELFIMAHTMYRSRSAPMPHIQGLHGIWVYTQGLEASKGDVYT